MTATVAPRVAAFDLMDTVVRDPFREALEAGVGLPLSEILANKAPDAWPAFERAELTEDEYWELFDRAGMPVDRESFHRARRAGYTWVAGMRELLDELEGVVTRVAASNYPIWVDELADGLLVGRFERVLASHHLGERKPDPAFYAAFLAELGVDAGEVLFVDDRERNVEAAEQAGMRAHHFTGAEDLRTRLRAEGVALDRG